MLMLTILELLAAGEPGYRSNPSRSVYLVHSAAKVGKYPSATTAVWT